MIQNVPFLVYIIGLSLQYPITNKMKIRAHPRSSKAPIGRNKMVRIMVMSKLLFIKLIFRENYQTTIGKHILKLIMAFGGEPPQKLK